MKYWFAEGKINVSDTCSSAGGFLVIYGNTAAYSIYDSVGHDDLLEEIASRNRIDKAEVLGEGIRLFFAYVKEGVVISGVRTIDNEKIASDPVGYAKIIREVLK
jgi:hypothetical protein